MNKIDKLFKSVKIYNIGTHLALNQIWVGLEWGGGGYLLNKFYTMNVHVCLWYALTSCFDIVVFFSPPPMFAFGCRIFCKHK